MDLLGGVLMSICPWGSLEPASVSFCERELCAWITQPANTWTNVAFFAAAFVLLRAAKTGEHSPQRRWFGHAAWVLGLGSGMFHATGRFVFEVWDLGGMFLFSGMALHLNFMRWRPYVKWQSVRRSFWVFIVISLSAMIFQHDVGIILFTVQVAAAALLEIALRPRFNAANYQHSLKMICWFLFAFVTWVLDITKVICFADFHWISGHGIWHIANAFAIYHMAMFYDQFKLNIASGAK
jgi:hypothetical protein